MKNERKYGVVLSYICIFVNMVVTLFYTPFMLEKIGQSEYGLYSMISSIIQYLSIFDFGFGNAIIVYASKCRANNDKEGENKIYNLFFKVYIVISIITFILCLVILLNINNIFGTSMNDVEIKKCQQMIIILTINLCLNFPLSLYNSIITINEKFIFQRSLSIFRIVMNPIIMTPLLFLGYKSVAMTAIISSINILCCFSNYYYCKRKLGYKNSKYKFDWKLFKGLAAYSFFIFLANVVDKLNWSTDQIILGSICGTTAVSIYAIATSFNNLFINFSGAISGVLLPKISKLITKSNKIEEITMEFIKVGRIQFYIVFLMITGLIVFGKEFILLWAGENYEKSYYVSLLLIIPVSIPLIQNLGIAILQAKNKYKFKSIVTLVMAIFNVIISIPLAKYFGAIGSALGTGISLVIINIIIMNLYYNFKIKLNIFLFWKNIFRILIPLLIPVLIIIILKLFLFKNNYIYLIIFALTYTLMYSFSAYYFCFNVYEKELINNFVKKIKIGDKFKYE